MHKWNNMKDKYLNDRLGTLNITLFAQKLEKIYQSQEKVMHLNKKCAFVRALILNWVAF